MAHFERPQYQRISLQTLNLDLTSNKEADVWIWGCGDDLEVRSTQEGAVSKIKDERLPNGYRKVRIKALRETPQPLPQIQVVFEGQHVWDWINVYVSQTGATPAGWDDIHHYKHPGNVKVRVAIYWSSNVTSDPTSHYIDVAQLVLHAHGLTLDVVPGRLRTAATTIPFDGERIWSAQQVREIRDRLKGVTPPGRLVCIVCPFDGMKSDGPNGYYDKEYSPPFIVINSLNHSKAAVTLLHEIGHAAGLGHEAGGAKDAVNNFMNDPTIGVLNGTDMTKKQVLAIAGAPFKG